MHNNEEEDRAWFEKFKNNPKNARILTIVGISGIIILVIGCILLS